MDLVALIVAVCALTLSILNFIFMMTQGERKDDTPTKKPKVPR